MTEQETYIIERGGSFWEFVDYLPSVLPVSAKSITRVDEKERGQKMDGKRGWGWAILLAPVAVWAWLRGLFDGKPPPPPASNASRWTESTWQDALRQDEAERWQDSRK